MNTDRLRTIIRYDRVLVLDHGNIAVRATVLGTYRGAHCSILIEGTGQAVQFIHERGRDIPWSLRAEQDYREGLRRMICPEERERFRQ